MRTLKIRLLGGSFAIFSIILVPLKVLAEPPTMVPVKVKAKPKIKKASPTLTLTVHKFPVVLTPIPVEKIRKPRKAIKYLAKRDKGVIVAGDDVWDALARCESSDGRDSANGKYHGYFQMLPDTARKLGGLKGDPSNYSYEEQKAAAKRIQQKAGFRSQWPACSRKLGLR